MVRRCTGKRGSVAGKGHAGGPGSGKFSAALASKSAGQHPKLAALMGLKSMPRQQSAAPKVTPRPRSAEPLSGSVRPISGTWPDHSPGRHMDLLPLRNVLSNPKVVPTLLSTARANLSEQMLDIYSNRGEPLPPPPPVQRVLLPAPDALQDGDVFKGAPVPRPCAPTVMFQPHRRAITLNHAPTVVHARGFSAKMTAVNENAPAEVHAS